MGQVEGKKAIEIVQQDNDRFSRSEYMAMTNIKSVEDAQKLLNNLKIFFWVTFLWYAALVYFGEYVPDDGNLGYSLFCFLYIVELIFFVSYCVKVLKAEKISKSDAIFCVILAPISWLWFYPGITEPLKIIIGEKQPPLRIYFEDAYLERERARNKNYWKWFFIILLGIVGVLFALGIITIIISSF